MSTLARKKKLVFTGLLAVGCLLAIEIACRIAVPAFDRAHWLDPVYADIASRDEGVREYVRISATSTFDRELGWDSSERIRGRRDLEPGKMRFMSVYGDSFSYGQYVRFSKSWPHLLETQCGEEVLNMACPGYGLDQAYLKFEKYYTNYPTRAVVLGLLPENINRCLMIFPNYYFDSHDRVPVPKPRFAVRSGEVELLAPDLSIASMTQLLSPATLREASGDDYWFSFRKRRYGYDSITGRRAIVPYTWYVLRILYGLATVPAAEHEQYESNYSDPDFEGVVIMKYIIDSMSTSADERGFTPILLVNCTRQDMNKLGAIEDFLEYSANRGFIVIRAADIFNEQIDRGLVEAHHIFRDDGHYSEMGNSILAMGISRLAILLRDGKIDQARLLGYRKAD